MIAANAFEKYTLLMGMHTMDSIITILSVSGVAYIPFAAAVAMSITDALRQGDDEGGAGELAIKFLRKRLLMMLPVFILAFIPHSSSVSMTTSTVNISACEEGVISSSTSLTSNVYGTFNGAGSYVPIWWQWVNDMSVTANNVTLANMPCAKDLTAIKVNYTEKNLPSVSDQQIAKLWNEQCLSPAAKAVSSTSKTYNSGWWVGHSDFTSQYAKTNVTLTSDLATSASLSSSTGQTSGSSSSVSVSCATVYQYLLGKGQSAMSSNNGTQEMANIIKTSTGISSSDAQNYVASLYFANVSNPLTHAVTINGNAVILPGGAAQGVDSGDSELSINGMIAAFTTAISNATNSSDAYAYRQGIPIQISVCVMVVLSVLPLVIVMSGYDLKVVLLLSAVYFGLRFTPAIAGFASWANNVMNLITGGGGADGSGIRYESAINVGLKMYTLLPEAWMLLLGYIGVLSIGAGFNNLAGGGQKALDAAVSAAKTVAKVSA